MNKKHIVGYGLTAMAFFGIGLAGGGGEAQSTATPTDATVTVTKTEAAPTPAEATVTVASPAKTETHTVTETVEAETVTETVEAEAVTETITVGPPAADTAIPGSGTFEVGVDVEPGTYVASAPEGDMCYWARLSGSDGLDSIIANHIGEGQMIVTIQASDRFFETNGCGPWSRRP